MTGFSTNLWAPWRMEYIRSLGEESEEGCFFCRYLADPSADRRNLVVWRGAYGFVVMNRFPYTGGHLLVAANAHEGDPLRFADEVALELTRMTWNAVELLRRTLKPEGFNVGSNLGHCAGAGVPDHFHAHIVPRWAGDTNYMAVIGDVRVVPESMNALYVELAENAAAMGLRKKPKPEAADPSA